MGSWAIVDRPVWVDRTRDAQGAFVYAPSLRALPSGMPLVMATLPISDWNGELLRALEEIDPVMGAHCYAAVMMIDPFTLWEDIADVLTDKRFAGVVNFPPAMLVETNPPAIPEAHFNELEIQRIRWFGENGLKIALTAVTPQGVSAAEALFPDTLEAVLYAPVDSLSSPVASVTPLSSADGMSSKIRVWSLPITPPVGGSF